MSTDLHYPQCCRMFNIYLVDSEGSYICCFMSTDIHCPQCCGCSISTLGTANIHIYVVLCLRIYAVLSVLRCSISTLGTVRVHIFVCFISTDLHCPQCCWMFYIYLDDSDSPYMFNVYESTLSSVLLDVL